jgi:hypothetical protein
MSETFNFGWEGVQRMPVRAIVEVIGFNKRFVWVRVPFANAHKILTLPRAKLRRGFRTARFVQAEWDPRTLKRTTYYTADMEFLSVISKRGEDKALDASEGPELT